MMDNWLAEDLAEASSDYAMTIPREATAYPALDFEDASRLRRKMAERYHGWTGRNLFEDLFAGGDDHDQ